MNPFITESVEFAGCDDNQSGQRFLDSSDPRLIRHVTACETVGGGVTPLPAGKDEKLSREFEGGALIGREATVPPLVWDTYPQTAGKDQKLSWGFGGEAPDLSGVAACLSSLDSLTNNRNNAVPDYYQRPIGRGKYCGRMSIKGTDPKTGRLNFRRVNCNSWTCSYCGPRKARTAKAAIRRVAEGLGLRYFLTLTLDMKRVKSHKVAVAHMVTCFNKFRVYLRRQFGVPPNYVRVLEFTQAGVPHFHILIDRYIDQRWISGAWAGLGGGRIVFIKRVTVQRVSRYLSKYLTKELLLSAPKGSRRITTSRSIKLFPKFNSGISWELLRQSIWRLLEVHRMKSAELIEQADLFKFISLELDEEKYLKAFSVVDDA